MKKMIAVGMSVLTLFGSCITSFAAEGWNRNDRGWWYEYADGSYAKNSWKWISGKKYYFNSDGYMLENRIAPNGHTVNSNGEWIVDGVVQVDNYDPNYPLKGMTEDIHLVTNGRGFMYSDTDENTSIWAAYNNSCHKYQFLAYYVDRLSGKIQSFDEVLPLFPEEAVRYEETYQVMKDFLNSFDWRNASDKTKLEMAAKQLGKADYLNTGSPLEHIAYGVLVQKKGVCDSFALSFSYLTRMMGMESAFISEGNHAYNVVKIDGKWYQFDGTDVAVGNETLMVPVDVAIENGEVSVSGFSTRNPGAFVIKLR